MPIRNQNKPLLHFEPVSTSLVTYCHRPIFQLPDMTSVLVSNYPDDKCLIEALVILERACAYEKLPHMTNTEL